MRELVAARGSKVGVGVMGWTLGEAGPRGCKGCTLTFHADKEDAAVVGGIAQVLPSVSAPCPPHPQQLPCPGLLQLHPPLAGQSLPVLVPAHSTPRSREVHHQLQVPARGAANSCLGRLGGHHPHGGLCGGRASGHWEEVTQGLCGGQWEAGWGTVLRRVGQGVRKAGEAGRPVGS